MSPASDTRIWRRNPDVVYRLVAGERLLVPVRGEAARARRLFTLNALGASIWELLEREPTEAGLLRELERRYPEVPTNRIRNETGAFLASLEKLGLVSKTNGEAAGGV